VGNFLSGSVLILTLMGATNVFSQTEPKLMGVPDLLGQPEPPADFTFQYGDDPVQFAELRLPAGEGPHPVAVLIHGGCWLAEYEVGHIRAMAKALTEAGMATWALEFRRIGNEQGGWPGTFLDVANGIDWLRNAADEHSLDLDRVVLAGHSAGGHLALWAAARHRLSTESELYLADPLPVKGVIGLAPAADMEVTYENQFCGGASQQLMGGTPEEFPQRYHDGSASALLPLGVPQLIINGVHDEDWLTVSRAYQEKARLAGEDVPLIIPADAGHFELVMPASSTFPMVSAAIADMLKQDTP
jgi:acetyl esterase/lipase